MDDWEIKEREGFELFSSMDTHALSQSLAESVKQYGRLTYWILKDEDVKAVTKIATDITAAIGGGWGFGFEHAMRELLIRADMAGDAAGFWWSRRKFWWEILTCSEFDEIGLPAEQIDDRFIWIYRHVKRKGYPVKFNQEFWKSMSVALVEADKVDGGDYHTPEPWKIIDRHLGNLMPAW